MQTPSIAATSNQSNSAVQNKGNGPASAEFSFDKILSREMAAPNLAPVVGAGAINANTPKVTPKAVDAKPANHSQQNNANATNAANKNANKTTNNAANATNNTNKPASEANSKEINDKSAESSNASSESASIAKGEPSPNAAGEKGTQAESVEDAAQSDTSQTVLGSAMPADMLALVASFNQAGPKTQQSTAIIAEDANSAATANASTAAATASLDQATLSKLEASVGATDDKAGKNKLGEDSALAENGFAESLEQAASGKEVIVSSKDVAKPDAELASSKSQAPIELDGMKKPGAKMSAAEGIVSASASKANTPANEGLPKMADILAASANKNASTAPDLALASRMADSIGANNNVAPSFAANTQFAQIATVQAKELVAPPVGSQGWDEAVGQKVVWMAAGGQQSAELTLNPPDMGPMRVVLNIDKDQASISFSAQQPEVRQALEAAMPKLREMMSEAGVTVTSSTVSAGMPNQQNHANNSGQNGSQSGNGNAGMRMGGDDKGDAPQTTRVSRVSSGLGVVDTFA